MYNVVCYWRTVSLYCELKTLNAVERRVWTWFSYWTLKTVSGVIKVTSSWWPLLYGHHSVSNTDTSLCPFGAVSVLERFNGNKLLEIHYRKNLPTLRRVSSENKVKQAKQKDIWFFLQKLNLNRKKMYKEKEVIHAEILTYTITTSCARIQLPDSGVEAEYFVFSIRYSNCQYSIFNIQTSIFNIQTSTFNIQTSIFTIQTSIFILFSLLKQLWGC